MNEMTVPVVAMTAWRENAGGGEPGMHSVINVIYNLAHKLKRQPYTICTEHKRFTSMSPPIPNVDPVDRNVLRRATAWADWGDPLMLDALSLAGQAEAGELEDLTEGSTLYYNPRGITTTLGKTITIDGLTYKFPDTWNLGEADYVITIASHLFFREG